MGWWKIQNTEDIVGDDVFSSLRVATMKILDLYMREWGRKPSRSEWEHLIADSLEPTDDEDSLFNESGRPQAVTIHLKSLDR